MSGFASKVSLCPSLSRCGFRTEELALWSAREPRNPRGSPTARCMTRYRLIRRPLYLCHRRALCQPYRPQWRRSWRKPVTIHSIHQRSPLSRSSSARCIGSSREDQVGAAPVRRWGDTGRSEVVKAPLFSRCGVTPPWSHTTTAPLPTRLQPSCIQDQWSSRCTTLPRPPTLPAQTRQIQDTGTLAWTTAHHHKYLVAIRHWRIHGAVLLWKAVGTPEIRGRSRMCPCLSCRCRRFWESWVRTGWEEVH